MMTEAQIRAKYGAPGDIANFKVIQLPYLMRIAWDLTHTVKAMQCHKLVAGNFEGVFNDLLLHYGLSELKKLNIDMYGGCYNFRQMRGGTSWSRHSWAIALDLWPQENGLHVPFKEAAFSHEVYNPMMDIFYKHGFFNLGKEKNYDTMHFEISL